MSRNLLALLSLLFVQKASAQSFYDQGTIQTIQIVFAQSNWDQLLDAQANGAEDYIMAQSVIINGEVYDSVGVKYKGNSTYNANQVKNPFHIELDTYKDHHHQGYTDIKLSNVAKDPSFLREVLSYQILRQYMDAPLSNYANVYVNGTHIGLYANSESITKKFVDSHFYSNDNAFFKCNPPAGAGPGSTALPNLVYEGPDSTDYYDGYEMKSDIGWQELLDLCDTLSNHVTDVPEILDVDRALWMIAFDNALVNLDSYIGGFAQNYYLYRSNNGQFFPIIWDLNESFGQFSSTGTGNLTSTAQKQQMNHLLHLNDAAFPLVQKLLNVQLYRRMYLAHFKTILLENFENGSYYTTAQQLQATINDAVNADPNKFYSYANFLSNINSDVTTGGGPGGGASPGITNLMNARSTYLLSHNDFTQTEPVISNVGTSTTSPAINDQFSITAAVTNTTSVMLGYRSSLGARFVRIPMYDDGAHNDGAAADGVYGVNTSMESTFVQYYIYADNTNIGKFSPARAEHEYYTVNALVPPVGDVVINELMASNNTTMADQDDEFDDWIELYNNTSSSIDLSGYFLTDDALNLSKWEIPSGTSIDANGYLIFWADEDGTQVGLHTNFKLSSSGETVLLVDPSNQVMDQVTYPAQTSDISYGRYPNGTGAFQTMTPTFNAQNTGSTGIGDVLAETLSVLAFPNPSNGTFHLEVGDGSSEQHSVEVFDLFGKAIYRNTLTNSLSISTTDWNAGVYLIRIDATVLKMVVQ
jgi:hypothetical protein